MRYRILGVLAAVVAAASLVGAKGTWTPSHTSDGQPDLQGYWTNATFTPVERPAELAGKEFFTPEEAEAYRRKRELEENSQSKDDIHYDNVIWQSENYSKVVSRSRTSLIYDPPDGKVPPLTPTGQRVVAARAAAARGRGPADAAEFRSLGERCISWGNEGPPMLGSTYYANLQILQADRKVVIRHEIMHGLRVIPVDGSPHIGQALRQIGGDGRGRWDGDTLVVDTTNFTERTNFRGPPATTRQDIFSSADLHVVERFKRTGENEILYRFTVDDPTMWVRPWSGELVLRKMEGPIFEYACHEGNYGLANILSAARAQEKAAE